MQWPGNGAYGAAECGVLDGVVDMSHRSLAMRHGHGLAKVPLKGLLLSVFGIIFVICLVKNGTL